MKESDRDLVRRARDGATEAFAELVARHERAVYGIAVSMIPDTHEAEDVAQNCFVEAYTRLGELRDEHRFGAWLRAIARNLCRAWRRQNSRRPVLAADPSVLDEAEAPAISHNPERRAIASAEVETLRRAVDELPSDYRSAVLLRHVAELSYQEVAEALGVSASAARVRCHRARRMLEERLAERTVSCEEER